ncbi:oxidoreductase [Rhizobium sp. CRIBSB]|nr:oxidoreductase [Rhizobium sp. CRIBSB]
MTTDPLRWAWAAGAVLLWLVLTVGFLRKSPDKVTMVSAPGPVSGAGEWLIAIASQTGFAEELAKVTGKLIGAAVPFRVIALGDLKPADLRAAERVLFIVSTTGEGDPPDSASGFVRKVMARKADLQGLCYGLLALGDRSYRDFCAFGRALDDWLMQSGAEPLFDRVELDNGDAGAVRIWQDRVATATGAGAAPDWVRPKLERWRLVDRSELNPGSPGGGAFVLAFRPEDGLLDWVAGDVAEIGVPVTDGPSPSLRQYSISSIPSDGQLELLVRRIVRPDGTPGVASGWLTGALKVGDDVAMRVRENRNFHGPAPATPLILVGNGTGIAGLRAHIKARTGEAGTWLLFGERTREHDAFFDGELQTWLASGLLTRLDRAFSRDAGDGRYVQTLVAEQAPLIADWVARGAAIYVCGSLQGMAPGVHAALEAALGASTLEDLAGTGRYRRDVY